ncbi:BMT1 [Candida pseudojiufengensis]|uniref:BMT1 n=1 Tax=Candida pseudojiufengensis TaxID=497109 RepID=UPI002224F610|nr:BMT1 [Candida pseudojiufengensis]KAI5958966.1 BMT1 [Candida pseudojiufengensis]
MYSIYKLCLILLAFSFISLLINLYDNQPINDIVIPSTNFIESELQNNNFNSINEDTNKIIIFPNDLKLNKNKLNWIYEKQLSSKVQKNDFLIVNNENSVKYPNDLKFENYKIGIFDSNYVNEELKQKEEPKSNENSATTESKPNLKCSDKFREIEFQISEYENRNANLTAILYQFMQSNSPYYQEIKELIPNLKQQLQENTINKYWFQLIGSSVWLEQYGIHLLTSRIFYTSTGNKVKPVISLIYVQIFDSNWNELKNVELIIPRFSKDKENNQKNNNIEYKSFHYPQFLPIPIYHNAKKQSGRFYGAEDPRLILIKNDMGFDEPLIIYNSYHRKISKFKTIENDNEGSIYFEFFRSIYIGWLWETQIGKNSIEEIDEKYKNQEYIKIKELILPNFKRMEKEKNWTPFIDFSERFKNNGIDKSINFIYQFKNLKILKCFWDKELCEWEYLMNKKNLISEFRGGTQLYNIREILDKKNDNYGISDPTPNNKQLIQLQNLLKTFKIQIWIGFARIALKNCGCGEKFYRPNLYMLIKNEETKKYQISHISKSIDFNNIKIKSWDENDQNLCNGKNLIIPNGISSWELTGSEDLLTLTFSRADVTIDMIYIKGLLTSLFSDEDENYIHNLVTTKIDEDNQDFTNFNVECSIKSAFDYCIEYSKSYKESNGLTNPS